MRRRRVLVPLLVLAALAAVLLLWATTLVRMPGRSHSGPLPPLHAAEQAVRDRLRTHVWTLAHEIGERHAERPAALGQARDHVADAFRAAGYEPVLRPFEHAGATFHNVEAQLSGGEEGAACLVVGAHYDTVPGTPGANDNASGVAVLLELAAALREERLSRAVRFVAFANEEPPYFVTRQGMGSIAYARALRQQGVRVEAMLSLETVGFYSDAPGSQRYPPFVAALFPDRGDFVAFVGNVASRGLLRRAVGAFRGVATLPSEGAALPSALPGIAWSDHRSFWDEGVPALMVTDTALFRDPHYHRATDTPERLDLDRMARLVTGLRHVVATLAGE